MRYKALWVIGLILVIGVFTAALAGEPKKDDGIITYYDYEEGLKKAEKDSMHVAVFFETTWCTWCKKMKKTTMKDKRVVELMKNNFIAVKVDGDKRKELTRSYNVRGYPATWFLKSDATKIAPAPGYWPAEDFYWLLRYIKDDAYEKEQFKAFMERIKKQEG
jgi:thioredoxin-related protein